MLFPVIKEASLPHNTSHDSLRMQLHKALKTAHGVEENSWSSDGPYIHDVFPSHVVYQHKNESFKRPYSVKYGDAGAPPTVKLGEAKPVHVAYVTTKKDSKGAVSESQNYLMGEWELVYERTIATTELARAKDEDFAGRDRSFPILKAEDVAAAIHSIGRTTEADNFDAATLKKNIIEIATRKGFAVPKESVNFTLDEDTESVTEGVVMEAAATAGSNVLPKAIPIKIIGPGWGSMAYYSEKMIKETGPTVFTKGTHMMWNHASASEEADRPEGDLSNLAAVLTKDAVWKDQGPKGPGLYSEAKVFSDYAQQVADKGPHIGVSINAAIKAHEGEAEGRRGRIADSFVKAYSTDFVTKAGAGGAPIVPVSESDRAITTNKETTMNEAEIKALQDENKALRESNGALTSRVTSMETSQNQLLAVATVGAILRESEIEFSPKLLKRACQDPVIKEGKLDTEWIKSVVGDFSEGSEGKVTGMGHTKEALTGVTAASKEAEKKVWMDLGLNEKAAEVAAGVK